MTKSISNQDKRVHSLTVEKRIEELFERAETEDLDFPDDDLGELHYLLSLRDMFEFTDNAAWQNGLELLHDTAITDSDQNTHQQIDWNGQTYWYRK